MKKAALFLLATGLLQMAGDIFGWQALKGIGAATVAAPAPKVFSAVRGLETYSTRFFVEWSEPSGAWRSFQIVPEASARLRGPYNRRNVYGAALAYGPVLFADPKTRPMFVAVAVYAMCGQASLLQELGVDSAAVADDLRLRYEPPPGTEIGDLPRLIEVPCR